MNLYDAEINKKIIVLSFLDDIFFAKKLKEMGLTEWCKVSVIRKMPYNGAVEIYVRGYVIAIRKKDALKIVVKYE